MTSPLCSATGFTRFPLLLAAGLVLASIPAPAQDNAADGIDPKAAEVMRAVARFHRELNSFSVEVGVGMKMEMQGMKTEMTTQYEFAAQRPNRLALVSKPAGFGAFLGGNMVSDGVKLHTHLPMLNKYTTVEAPAGFEGMIEEGGIVTMQSGPGMAFLASMVADEPYEKFMEGVTGGTHRGQEKLGETECHRLHFQQDQFDWDIWVATGPEPRVLKIVPDMAKTFDQLAKADIELPEALEGIDGMKMEFTVDFKNWSLNPELPAGRFTFTPPAGAEQVADFFEALGVGGGKHALLGLPAPALKLDLLDGGRLDLEKHRGNEVVVLDFWATWCGPCVKGLPILAAVTEAYKDKGVVFYAVNQGEDRDTIEPFLTKHKLKLNVALDPESDAGEAYAVEGIPQTVLIGKDGTVEAVHVGLLPNLKSKLQQELDALIAGKKLAGE